MSLYYDKANKLYYAKTAAGTYVSDPNPTNAKNKAYEARGLAGISLDELKSSNGVDLENMSEERAVKAAEKEAETPVKEDATVSKDVKTGKAN